VAEYFDLAPGDYTFRVRAANNDGVWNETGAALAFTVQPHYWQTLWFRTGGVILLFAAGAGFVWRLLRFRHARMEEKLTLQQQRGELARLGRETSLSELFGSLAHEPNKPLAAILSNAQAASAPSRWSVPPLAPSRIKSPFASAARCVRMRPPSCACVSTSAKSRVPAPCRKHALIKCLHGEMKSRTMHKLIFTLHPTLL
jgi:signal transduction histidine kinase